ncbi:unnamed protein product [Adineta steineri]|uniref:DYW domain-containing protein n=1 Tax=Adineta steineri TaxID=433720 RepID=A0A815AUK7_9BILA|nr:unnamed protein product [Adineta steineri]CAF4131939.1 unnamed protein product [Adineta steineri]
MIDCFSRSNLVNEAEELINEYKKSHLPSYSMYMSILSAARNRRNSLLAQKMYNRIEPYLKDQEIYATSAKVLLANTYALAGDLTTVSNIRMKMNQSGLKKLAGLSWTVVKFRVHDRSHPQSNEICEELERLTNELKQHGYQCDASWISQPLTNNEKSFKWVAQVRQCTIIVRDANRTHHFYPDGHYSCGDFF